MKTKKLWYILLQAVVCMSLLGGCGEADDTPSDTSGHTEEASGEEPSGSETPGNNEAAEPDENAYDTEIDMTEEPYTVAIQLVTIPGVKNENLEDVETTINEITLSAINCTVEIQEIWISEIANTTSMAVAGGEKIDLVHVATVSPLSSMVGSDLLLDMNEGNLLQNRGQRLIQLFGEELMASGNVNGKQLAVPAVLYTATEKGFSYNKTIADANGIRIPERGTIEEFGQILHQVKDKVPEIKSFFVGEGINNLMFWMYGYEGFGVECSYGAIMDSSKNLTVENLYASDAFRDYCLEMYRWRQDGILVGDATDSVPSSTYFENGQLFAKTIDINEKIRVSGGASMEDEIGYFSLVDARVTNSSITEFMWGIASNSQRPDKAMDFLNFLYTNAEVANLLRYGLEGIHYEYLEGSDDIIITNGSYTSGFTYAGDESIMLIQYPGDENYIVNKQTLEERAFISPLCGYMFDDSKYQAEASTIYAAILEYLPTLQNGMYSSEEETLAMIDAFNEKLEASGINDVIAANQEQLDAYLSAQ